MTKTRQQIAVMTQITQRSYNYQREHIHVSWKLFPAIELHNALDLAYQNSKRGKRYLQTKKTRAAERDTANCYMSLVIQH